MNKTVIAGLTRNLLLIVNKCLTYIMGLRVKPAMTNCCYILLFLCLLSSCASTYSLLIDVQEPAPITLPPHVANVLVVNNSVKQDIRYGIERTYEDKAIENYPLDMDSTAWISIEVLAEMIKESDYFQEVSYYKESIRKGGEWLAIEPVSKEFRDEFFDISGYDAIISVDRLVFNMKEKVKKNAKDYYNQEQAFVDIKIESILSVSIYIAGKERPVTSFSINDSISYMASVYADSVSIFKEWPERLIDNLAVSIGEKLAYYIIPSWVTQERIIYAGTDARMSEALSFAKNGKWESAKSLWVNEYNRQSKNLNKGKLSNNIAIIYEMQDEFESALSWAEKAKEYFTNSGLSEDTKEWIWINSYIPDLQNRIQNNPKLNMQLGGDNH